MSSRPALLAEQAPNRSHDMTTTRELPSSTYFAAIFLALITFLSRYLTGGPIYMVDGPRLAAAIANKSYVIQPPGYWLFAHLGGLFQDPPSGLAFWNRLFSALGVGIMFLLCSKLGRPPLICWLAALAYGTIFFVWFAGDTHSSYPSQLLFTPLFLYNALRYKEGPSYLRLILWAAAFSIGAGLRPSDGAFLLPLYIFFWLTWIRSTRHRAVFALATLALCLSWYLPSQAALKAVHGFEYNSALGHAFRERSVLLGGLMVGSLLNITRVLLPLGVAFWMFLPAIVADRPKAITPVLWLWALPGLGFLVLIYMADADYLTFCTGAVILAVALTTSTRAAAVMLTLCFLWNTALFLGARPLPGDGTLSRIVNFYVIKYCHYGVLHQWTTTLGTHGAVPR